MKKLLLVLGLLLFASQPGFAACDQCSSATPVYTTGSACPVCPTASPVIVTGSACPVCPATPVQIVQTGSACPLCPPVKAMPVVVGEACPVCPQTTGAACQLCPVCPQINMPPVAPAAPVTDEMEIEVNPAPPVRGYW